MYARTGTHSHALPLTQTHLHTLTRTRTHSIVSRPMRIKHYFTLDYDLASYTSYDNYRGSYRFLCW